MAVVAISILRRFFRRFSLGALFIFLTRFRVRQILNISRVMIAGAIPGISLNGLMSGQDRRLENVTRLRRFISKSKQRWMENS